MPTYAVCPTCKGRGYTSKLGAFTGDELDEEFGNGDERAEFIEEYTREGGVYDDRCKQCDTRRVVLVCAHAGCELPREWIDNAWGKGHEAGNCRDHLSTDELDLEEMNSISRIERMMGA